MSDYGKRHGIQYFPVTNCRLLGNSSSAFTKSFAFALNLKTYITDGLTTYLKKGTYLVLFCTSHLRIHLSDIQVVTEHRMSSDPNPFPFLINCLPAMLALLV